jgi:hypothetical protein
VFLAAGLTQAERNELLSEVVRACLGENTKALNYPVRVNGSGTPAAILDAGRQVSRLDGLILAVIGAQMLIAGARVAL